MLQPKIVLWISLVLTLISNVVNKPYPYGTGLNGNMPNVYQNQSTMPYNPSVGGVAGVTVPNNAYGVQPQYANQGTYVQPQPAGYIPNQVHNAMGYSQVPNASQMLHTQQGLVGQSMTQNPITGAIQTMPGSNMMNGVLQTVPGGNMMASVASNMLGSHMGVPNAYPNQTLQNASMFPTAQPGLMNTSVYGAQPGFPQQRQWR